MTETQRHRELRELLLTAPAKLLIWLYEKGGEARLQEARETFGTNIYTVMYKLALHGLAELTEERRGKRVRLSEKGFMVAKCLSTCFDTNSVEEGL